MTLTIHSCVGKNVIWSDMKTDRMISSILGLALGDAFGAPYEGGVLERTAWAQ